MSSPQTVLAIDPGNERSAWVLYRHPHLYEFGIHPNDELLRLLRNGMAAHHLAIEMVACYGMAVGREVFETCRWIGRLEEAWLHPDGCAPLPESSITHVYRRDVKLSLCNSMKAKDANVRQALIDRFGPGKDKAVGTKRSPGPLYGVSKDVWAALGVAVTWAENAGQLKQSA